MFVPVDGPASQEQVHKIRSLLPKYTESLSNEELHYISTLIDANKAASDIFLDYNLVAPALPAPTINWCYGLEYFPTTVQINPKTLRPFYTVEGKVWTEAAKTAFKVEDVSKLFKGVKYI